MLYLEYLPSELLLQLFHSLSSIPDVLALSSTCKRLHDMYASTQQLPILEQAAEAQFGPLQDAIQLITHNDSQAAHVIRQVSVSLALIKQIVQVGRVAESWAQLYPFKRWKDDFADRRLLTPSERRCVRRAVYRLWLYDRAFHTATHPRELRLSPMAMRRRAELLRACSSVELAEMADVRTVMREVLASNVCPSNATVARKWRKRHPDHHVQHGLVFNLNIHLNFAPPPPLPLPLSPRLFVDDGHDNHGLGGAEADGLGPSPRFNRDHYAHPPPSSVFHSSPTYAAQTRTKAFHLSRYHGADAGSEGWGDSISHYYIIEDMMKLDPEQILQLKERKLRKAEVEYLVRQKGDWFDNYGDTWGETAEFLLVERGEDPAQVLREGGIVSGKDEDDSSGYGDD